MGWHRKKDYVCTMCEKDFDSFRQVQRHMIDVHGKTVDKNQEQYYKRDNGRK